MTKKYVVTLSDADRTHVRNLIRHGKTTALTVARAHMLLLADEGWSDAAIASSLHVGTATVERTRKKFVDGDIAWALRERSRTGGQPKLDGKQEAFLVALACSEPPHDRPVWTVQLLADRLVAIGVVNTISDETVRRVLKKRSQAMVERAVVHPHGQIGVRVADGSCVGPVCGAV